MRQIKFFITGIVLLLCLFSAFTFFLPSKVTVSKSTLINASAPAVINQVQDFDNWKNWFPAFMDTTVAISILHSQNEQANSAELNDNSGRKIIFKMLPLEKSRINVELFTQGKNSTIYQFILIPDSIGNTEIIWNVVTDLGWYPWKKLQGIVMDKVTGPQYVLALQNLKKAAESPAPTDQAK